MHTTVLEAADSRVGAASTRRISIVVPVYSSAATLPVLVERLVRALDGRQFEIILVDDCSRDGSWAVLKALKTQYGGLLKIVRLLTNRGQHNAILCGFSRATGDIVVTMDDDLQNPPEEVPKLVAAVAGGFDLAIAAYDSKKHSTSRNVAGILVDSVQRHIFKLPRHFALTSFRAISRAVVDQVNLMGGVFPYVTAMLLSNASTYTNVPVEHHPRFDGRSNYSVKKGVRLSANLLLSYSSLPVAFVGVVCAFAFLSSTALAGVTLYRALAYGTSVPGWASTILVLTLLDSIMLLVMLIVLVYIVRINQQFTRTRVSYAIGEIEE